MKLESNIYNIPVGTKQKRGTVIPVFLPFAGCPFQCIYCAQDRQSGAGQISIREALHRLDKDVEIFIEKNTKLSKSKDKVEIAFYGGTFTALQECDLSLCLDAFKKIKIRLTALNIKVFGRCSTRPDCLGFENSPENSHENSSQNTPKKSSGEKSPENMHFESGSENGNGNESGNTRKKNSESIRGAASPNAILSHLKNAGIDLIELGIQSFDTKALEGIGRGYSSAIAKTACQYVKDNGFELGIQLMPAIPNQSVETFHSDVEIALGYKPACVRYYPCLVPDGTGLARLWQAGKFVPWDLQTCVDALGHALHRAWQEKIPVIRLSVAPEADFDKHILAGVRHPALGSLIQAKALLYSFDSATKKMEYLNAKDGDSSETGFQLEFHVPKNFQGFIFGEKNSLKEEWETRVGLENIFFDAEFLENPKSIEKVENFITEFAFFVKKML